VPELHVANLNEAHLVLLEVLDRIDLRRFPMPITIRPQKYLDTFEVRTTVVIKMSVTDRDLVTPRDALVTVPLSVRWEYRSRSQYARDLAMAIYAAVRQCVLHEVAECFEYEGRLIDDPHTSGINTLREEHDIRFPDFRMMFL
jgi:hypothetical protein